MPCRCDERKQELAERGVGPLVGKDYTPLDAARWGIMKAFDRVLGR
ncbi:MAG: hypothetical protein LN413_03825 [Candidatus Thermoplasmatota archaeon]|nr:hypothetical protein [Candidatus Thermoplasmatota archaeon]